MLTPRVSSSTSKAPKKNSRSRWIGPPRSSPHWCARAWAHPGSGTFDGVERVVAQEEEGGGAPVVGARARDDVGDAALGAAELGLVAGGDDLELLDRVLGVAHERAAVERVVVVGAVDEEGDRGRRARRRSRPGRGAALGPAGHRGRAGHQRHQVHEVAGVERQRVDRLLVTRSRRRSARRRRLRPPRPTTASSRPATPRVKSTRVSRPRPPRRRVRTWAAKPCCDALTS